MSKNYYTNVQSWGNSVLFRGIVDGQRIKERLEYSPSLWVPSKKPTEWKTLKGDYLERKEFNDISSAKEFTKMYDGVSNAPEIFGNTRYEYAFIAEHYPNDIEWSLDDLEIGIIDIEVGSENGFPDPYVANEPITAICLTYLNGDTFVFGCGDYQVQGKEKYIKCPDEYHLCKSFLTLWSKKTPDIITGWNTKFFDIPYLYNRLNRVLGEEETRKLSPWRFIMERKEAFQGRQLISYEIKGVASLDYLILYKWYSPHGKSQESYKLDAIAHFEINAHKLSYDEYESLHQLYKLNFQKFIEYNIKDVDLIVQMEDKLKLLELAITLAYDTKSNFEDVFAQTRMWDAMTASFLYNNNIVVPPKVVHEKDEAFIGAYVKEVQVGKHEWVAAFDLDSLYSHLMMQYSISPETLVDRSYIPERKKVLIEELKRRNQI